MYKRKNNGLILGILFVCLLSLSVGLAALSTTLNINASSTVNASSWDIHFNSITQTGGSTGVTGSPGNIIGGTSIENLQASLPLRGTYIEFTAEIHNEGDFPAFLNYYNLNTNLTCSGGTENENKNVCDYITVTVTGVGSGDLTTFPRMNGSLYNEPLAVNATRQIKIRVDYDKDNQITADKLVNKPILVSGINLTIQYSFGTGTQSDANIVNSIKTSSTGSIVTLNNTVGKKLDSFTLYGNTSQNGTPSPTNPVPINVVTGENVVKVNGKNLTNIGTKTFTQNAYCPIGTTLTPGTYTISYKITSSDTDASTSLLAIYTEYAGERLVSVQKDRGQRVSQTFTLSKNATYIYLYASSSHSNGAGDTAIFEDIQIERGSTATPYESYKGETTYNLNLGNIELAQIGAVQDSITYEGGKWYLNKQIGKVVFNGSENWQYLSPNLYYTDNNIMFDSPLISNYYANRNYNTDNSITTGRGDKKTFWINDSRYYDDISGFKTWLASNNVTVYYLLATSTKTEITDTSVVNSLNSIKNINTVAGATTISISGTNVNPSIQVKY